jgi:hypothetical protein
MLFLYKTINYRGLDGLRESIDIKNKNLYQKRCGVV